MSSAAEQEATAGKRAAADGRSTADARPAVVVN
ncbi:hypothetical protein SMCF_4711, partial [Streptomyces coelicoflavus ZG0656]